MAALHRCCSLLLNISEHDIQVTTGSQLTGRKSAPDSLLAGALHGLCIDIVCSYGSEDPQATPGAGGACPYCSRQRERRIRLTGPALDDSLYLIWHNVTVGIPACCCSCHLQHDRASSTACCSERKRLQYSSLQPTVARICSEVYIWHIHSEPAPPIVNCLCC